LKEHASSHAKEPFFLYLAFISPHFPLHGLPEDIARYKDVYKVGWDKIRENRWKRLKEVGIVNCDLAPLDQKLSPRYFKTNVLEQLGPGEIRYAVPWDTLNEEQKNFQATKMSIHAAMVDRMDQEIGRVLDQLRAMKAYDDTVIFFLSDNGADATVMVRGDGHDKNAVPGSAKSFLCIGPGWASASNTPFRRHKVWVSEGGISTPLIVHWPHGISAHGELRHDMGHVIDFVPTLLELAGGRFTNEWHGTKAPGLPGESLVPDFAADGRLKTHELFFDHEGNRSLRVDNWKLVSAREDNDEWQLFDLGKDRCEKVNAASANVRRVEEMRTRWASLEKKFRAESGYATDAKRKKRSTAE
jgi:arylsulfatase